MKLEATALFTQVRALSHSPRWWYFASMRQLSRPVAFEQSLSAYRASLHCDYVFCGIDCQLYLEREAHVGQPGDDMWMLSVSGIEGKVKANFIHEQLRDLQLEGYYIPNGNENLERQMNFSLGLYGACLMHVDVKFPTDRPPLPCALRVLDLLDTLNHSGTADLGETLRQLDEQRAAALAESADDDPDIMMGDWQTWK